MSWSSYKREVTPNVGAGDHRCVIFDVEEAISKTSGNNMIVVTVQPNGSRAKVKNYIVYNEWFNQNMTRLFDAFPSIGDGNFNFLEWVGAMGAAKFAEDENGYLKVVRFLSPDKAAKLPEWQGAKPEQQSVSSVAPVENDDFPF